MAGEQTAYLDSGSTGTDVVIAINCIDSTGSHTALTIDTTTTRLYGYSVVPTVDLSVGTGIAKITFANVQSLAEGQRLICKVNGTAGGTAFSEYGIPVVIKADERGTDNASTFDNSVDTVITDAASRTASQADVSLLATSADLAVVDANVYSILVDTSTDIPASISALNDFDPSTDQVIVATNNDKTGYSLTTAPPTAAEIYTEFVSGSNEDAFKADVTGISAQISALNDLSTTDVENSVWDAAYASHTTAGTFGKLMDILRKANRAIEGQVAGTPTASAFDTDLTGYTSGAFDHETLVFLSGALEGEARPILSYDATNGRITFEEALTSAPTAGSEFAILPHHVHPISEIYAYFTDGSNDDAFKADVSALASQASVDTVDGIVDAIKLKTDELTFTVPGSVDATAVADVDEAAIAAAVVAGIGGADVTISSPVASDGTTITIVRGDDYNSADGRSIIWTGETDDQWPDLTGATVVLTAINKSDLLKKTLTVTQPTGTQSFNMQLNNAETEITSGRYKYDVQATLASGHVITLLVGELMVKKSYAELVQ